MSSANEIRGRFSQLSRAGLACSVLGRGLYKALRSDHDTKVVALSVGNIDEHAGGLSRLLPFRLPCGMLALAMLQECASTALALPCTLEQSQIGGT